MFESGITFLSAIDTKQEEKKMQKDSMTSSKCLIYLYHI